MKTKRYYTLSDSYYCKTNCPMDEKIGIGSISCKKCRYFRANNDLKNYVTCAWEGGGEEIGNAFKEWIEQLIYTQEEQEFANKNPDSKMQAAAFYAGAESCQSEIERLKIELADLNNAYIELMDECMGYKRCLGLGYKD